MSKKYKIKDSKSKQEFIEKSDMVRNPNYENMMGSENVKKLKEFGDYNYKLNKITGRKSKL